MKKLIKKIINKLGFDLIKLNPKQRHFDFRDIHTKISKNHPVIFDVGGNNGQSIEAYLRHFNYPIIHSFEPVKTDFDLMVKKFKDNKDIFLNNFALGDQTGEKELNITASTVNSSFNKIKSGEDWLKARSNELKVKNAPDVKDFKIITTQKVNIIKLDDYVKDNKINHIDLLKIDTQGYEDKVLEGSLDTLRDNKVKAIITEIMFDDIYDKYFSFSDIEKFILPYNFRMVGLRLPCNNLFSGSGFGCDVFYLNKNYHDI